MASLSETNKYLSDPKVMAIKVARSTYESSVFEGASPRALGSIKSSAYPLSKASSKKKADLIFDF